MDEENQDDNNGSTTAPSPSGRAGVGLLYFYHPDHLGTSSALTDINGVAYQFFLNLPFGETMAEQSQAGLYHSPYKFNGKELDDETGFYYYGARYYDPRISIWASVDPLAEKAQDMNPYAYCEQNPIVLIDPDGRWPENPFSGYINKAKQMARNYVAKKIGQIIDAGRNYVAAKINEVKTNIKKVCSNISLPGSTNGVESGGGGYDFRAKGKGTTDLQQKRRGDCEVKDVSGLYVLADFIGCNQSANSWNSNAENLEKTISVLETAKKAKEGFDLGGEVAENVEEAVKETTEHEKPSDTLFSVTRKIDSQNVNIDIVSGSKKADSIMKKHPKSEKKIEKIY